MAKSLQERMAELAASNKGGSPAKGEAKSSKGGSSNGGGKTPDFENISKIAGQARRSATSDISEKIPEGFFGGLAASFLGAQAVRKRFADPMFALKQRLEQQNATMNQIDIADRLMTREFEIKKARNDAALSQLKRLEAQRQMELAVAAEQFYREGSDFVLDAIAKDETLTPEFQKRYLEFTTRTPLINDARWAGLSKTVQQIQTLKRQQLQVEQAKSEGLDVSSRTIQQPGGGSITLRASDAGTPTQITKLFNELDAATKAGQTDRVQALKAAIASESESEGMIVETTPDGGMRIIQGRGVTDTTVATKSRLQQSDLEIAQTVNRAKRLAGLLKPANVGPGGILNRFAEEALANIDPSFKVGTAVEAASVARQLKSGLIKALKSDGNIAERERKELEDAMPDPTRWVTSPQAEKVRLASTLQDLGETSRRNAEAQNKPVTPMWLRPSEIQLMHNQGTISDQEAATLLDQNMWLFIDDLRREVQR